MDMDPPDLNSGVIEEFDIPDFNDIDDIDEYDVTGLSEKMHSIPIEAIHAVPPSQINNSDEEVTMDKAVAFEISGLANDTKINFSISAPSIEHSVVAEKVIEEKTCDKLENLKNGYFQPSPFNSELIEDLDFSLCRNKEITSVPDVENEKSIALSPLENHVNDDLFPKTESAFEDLKHCDSRNVENTFNDTEKTVSVSAIMPESEDNTREAASDDKIYYAEKMLIVSDNVENQINSDQENGVMNQSNDVPDRFASFDGEAANEDDFGEFDSAFCSTGDTKVVDYFDTNLNQIVSDGNLIPERCEEPVFDDSDDDFGDFGEIVSPQDQVASPSIENDSKNVPTVFHNTPRQSTNSILNELEANISSVISNLVLSLSDDVTSNQSCDTQSSLQPGTSIISTALDLRNIKYDKKDDETLSSIEKTDINSNDVWLQICNFEKTPAIKLSWTQTSLNRKNFKLLDVDPEYVEREIVNKRRKRKDGTELPKFASGLADTDLSSNGVSFLKPTPILTPEVVKPNDSSRKPSNDSGIVEEQQNENYIGITSDSADQNSNSTITLSSDASKPNPTSDGIQDFDGLNDSITQVSHPAIPGNELDWMANNLNEMNGVQNGVAHGISDPSGSSTNDYVAQSKSIMEFSNLASSASHNSSEHTSNSVDYFRAVQDTQETNDTISSSDIFSQIGNLVKANQKSAKEQLPKLTMNEFIPTYESKTKGNNTLKRSQEASSIISAFPLLDFMQSPHLMLPLQSDNLKKINEVSKNDDILEQKIDIVRKDSGTTVFTTTDMVSNKYNLYELNADGNAI